MKHVYFIAETKGDLAMKNGKIKCARKFFAGISAGQNKYDAVASYEDLMKLVR